MGYKRNFLILAILIFIGTVIQFETLATIGLHPNIEITEIGQIDTGGDTYFVQIEGEIAVVSDINWGGLRIINITDPKEPKEIGRYIHEGGKEHPHDTVIRGDLVYLADRSDGLEIIDISDPTNPEFVAQIDTGGYAWGIQVSGDLAYVADINEGLKIINVTNPYTPVLIGNFTDQNYNSIQVVGDTIAYVTVVEEGVKIIDVSDPTNCSLIGIFSSTNPWGVQVVNNTAYIADLDNGFKIVNVQVPSQPTQLTHYGATKSCLDVQIVNNLAFVSEWRNGLEILDISNSSDPKSLIQYQNVSITKSVRVKDNLIFVADSFNGLVILEMSMNQSTTQSTTPIFLFSTIFEIITLLIYFKRRKRT